MSDEDFSLGAKRARHTIGERMMRELEAENFRLAANQCKAGYSGEHGDHMCHLIDALRSVRIYVQDCIETGHDRTMLGNLYSARDEIDAALAKAGAR